VAVLPELTTPPRFMQEPKSFIPPRLAIDRGRDPPQSERIRYGGQMRDRVEDPFQGLTPEQVEAALTYIEFLRSQNIDDYVVEDHGDRVLATFKTQREAIEWAKKNGHTAHVRSRHLQPRLADTKKPRR
jgi:hypothetical protein